MSNSEDDDLAAQEEQLRKEYGAKLQQIQDRKRQQEERNSQRSRDLLQKQAEEEQKKQQQDFEQQQRALAESQEQQRQQLQWEQQHLSHRIQLSYPEQGLQGYQSITQGFFLFPNKTEAEARNVIQSLDTSLNQSCNATGSVQSSITYVNFSNFMHIWSSTNGPESVGTEAHYGTWLLDGPALTQNITKLKNTMRENTPSPWIWIVHVVADPGVRSANPVGGSYAALPAWRNAYVHFRKSCPR